MRQIDLRKDGFALRADRQDRDDQRSKTDIVRPLALINDYYDAGEGELGEVLRPMYVDYLVEHEH